MTVYNFCHKDRLSEKDEYFLEGDKIIAFDDESFTIAHLLADAGKFHSVTEGRKNGFGDDIPAGWTEKKIGKDRVYILNTFPHWNDDDHWSNDNPLWCNEIFLTSDHY